MNSTLPLLHLTSLKRRTRRSTSNFNGEEANVSRGREGSRETEIEADLTGSGTAPSREVGEVTGRSGSSCVSKPAGGEAARAMQEKRVPGKRRRWNLLLLPFRGQGASGEGLVRAQKRCGLTIPAPLWRPDARKERRFFGEVRYPGCQGLLRHGGVSPSIKQPKLDAAIRSSPLNGSDLALWSSLSFTRTENNTTRLPLVVTDR